MVQRTSPFVEVKYGWNLGESGWNGGMDENLLKFSCLFDGNLDGIVTSLPAEVNGKTYFLTTDSRLYFVASGTYYSTPCPKWFTLKDRTTGNTFQYNGSSLVSVPSNTDLDERVVSLEMTQSDLNSEPLNYSDGSSLTIERPTQEIVRDNITYRVKLPSTFPVTLSGVWEDDVALLNLTSDRLLRADLSSEQGATMLGESRWGGNIQTALNKLPYYLSAGGFFDGTDKRVELQALIDSMSASGGGEIIFDSDVDLLVSGVVNVKSNMTLRWIKSGFMKLTGSSTTGALLVCSAGNTSLPPVENITIINPRLDCNNIGFPTGATYGENGLAGTRCRHVRVYGGLIKNCKNGSIGTGSSGGTGVNFETGVEDVVVFGTEVENCSQAFGSSAAFNTTAPLDFRTAQAVVFRDVVARDCGLVITCNQATNPPYTTGDVMSVAWMGVTAYNCGRHPMAGQELAFAPIVFDRAANVVIDNFRLYNTEAYGAIPAVVRHIRGTSIKLTRCYFEGPAVALVSHVRPDGSTQYTTAGTLQNNLYEIEHAGTPSYLVQAINASVTGTWLNSVYRLSANGVVTSLTSLDSGNIDNSNYAEITQRSNGRRIVGSLGTIRTNGVVFTTDAMRTIGVSRFNTMNITFGSGTDTLLADGALQLGTAGTVRCVINSSGYILPTLTTAADNTAATSAGVPVGALYKTATGELRVRV